MQHDTSTCIFSYSLLYTIMSPYHRECTYTEKQSFGINVSINILMNINAVSILMKSIRL